MGRSPVINLLTLQCDVVFEEIGQSFDSILRWSSNMIFLRTAPLFDPIRDHPRFQAIMEQMDFPL